MIICGLFVACRNKRGTRIPLWSLFLPSVSESSERGTKLRLSCFHQTHHQLQETECSNYPELVNNSEEALKDKLEQRFLCGRLCQQLCSEKQRNLFHPWIPRSRWWRLVLLFTLFWSHKNRNCLLASNKDDVAYLLITESHVTNQQNIKKNMLYNHD